MAKIPKIDRAWISDLIFTSHSDMIILYPNFCDLKYETTIIVSHKQIWYSYDKGTQS